MTTYYSIVNPDFYAFAENDPTATYADPDSDYLVFTTDPHGVTHALNCSLLPAAAAAFAVLMMLKIGEPLPDVGERVSSMCCTFFTAGEMRFPVLRQFAMRQYTL